MFVAVFTLLIILDNNQRLLCCFLSAICHEAGHILAMCKTGKKPEKITFQLFDIKITDSKRVVFSFKEDSIVVSAGICVNFLLSLISLILYYISNSEIFLSFSIVNMFTGVFNALPVSNLDGGQALYLLLTQKFSDTTANKVIDILTIILIFPTAILGFILLFNSKYNFSLLLISIYLIIALMEKNSKFY